MDDLRVSGEYTMTIGERVDGIERSFEELAIVVQGLQQYRPDVVFESYCRGFEHLCHGVLYLKNYGVAGDMADALATGCCEVFEKIRGMV